MRGLTDAEARREMEQGVWDDEPDFEYDTLGQGIPREAVFPVGGRRVRFAAVSGSSSRLSTRAFHAMLILTSSAAALYLLFAGWALPFFLAGEGRGAAEWAARFLGG